MTTTRRDDLTPDELTALRQRERQRQQLCRQRRQAGEPAPAPRRRTLRPLELARPGEQECPEPTCRRAARYGGHGPLQLWCCAACLEAAQPTLRLWPTLTQELDPEQLRYDYRGRRAQTETLLAAAALTRELGDELLNTWRCTQTPQQVAEVEAALALLNVADPAALVARRSRRYRQARWQRAYRADRTRGTRPRAAVEGPGLEDYPPLPPDPSWGTPEQLAEWRAGSVAPAEPGPVA